jgi:putative redox protein
MESLVVDYLGGMKFRAKVRGHEIISDLSPEKGGQDEAPSPPELLVAALGSCLGVYANFYAERHNISLAGMKIEVDWEIAENPKRIGKIDSRIFLPPGIPEQHHQPLLKFAGACLVHQTFHQCPLIEVSLVNLA